MMASNSKTVGLLLAGGTGSRLEPVTQSLNKHFLNIYDKPMIYYSLSLLMFANLREIIIICRPEDEASYKTLLGTGEQWGMDFKYVHQSEPRGIAEVFLLCESEIGGRQSVLALGDNILHGARLPNSLRDLVDNNSGASILAYPVKNPQEFGVAELDEKGDVLSLEEKPLNPKSNLAVPGFYCYDHRVVEFAKSLKPSQRGELEITDLNRLYLKDKSLKAYNLGRGVAWLDGGTPEGLFEAALYVRTLQKRTGQMIACPEEIALYNKWITISDLKKLCQGKKSEYWNMLLDLCHD